MDKTEKMPNAEMKLQSAKNALRECRSVLVNYRYESWGNQKIRDRVTDLLKKIDTLTT